MVSKRILCLSLMALMCVLAGCAKQVAESQNEAPRFFQIPAQIARTADAAFSDILLDSYVEDEAPDSLLQWTIGGAQTLTASVTNRVLRVTFPANFEGEELLQIKVTDPEGLEARQTVHFTVVNMETKEQRQADGTVIIAWSSTSAALGRICYGESVAFLEREAMSLSEAATTLSVSLKAVASYRTYWYRFVTVSTEGVVLFESPVDSFETFEVTSAPIFRMTTIDVRQGDSHLIETPAARRILIDGGYGTHEPSFGDGPWDGDGVPLALNYLQARGIFYLDHIVETHHDADHWGGLDDILHSDIAYGTYHSVSAPNGLIVGEEWDIGDTSVVVTVLNVDYPEGIPHEGENNRSIVLKFTVGEIDFVFTGDAETPVNAKMIMRFGSFLQSEVLKIGHHGSSDATTAEWLNTVSPLFAVISCGAGNPYGHPHSQTVDLLEARNVRILRTDETGTIDILTDGRSVIEIWP